MRPAAVPCALAAFAAAATGLAAQQPALAVDHVPVAVRQLRDAEREYSALGFTIKAGRAHANGLRNAFIKFADGTQLELIAPERGETDPTTRDYSAFLARHEGGAYLSLRADSLESAGQSIRAAIPTRPVSRTGDAFVTAVPADSSLRWLFFIEYLTPVQDRDELLVHHNGALGIETVWLSGRARAGERVIRKHLRPGSVATVPGLADGPPVAGVTLRVPDVSKVQQLLGSGPGLVLPIRTDGRGRSIRVPAASARGLWIEFLERE
jgi:hypothetical protein